MARDLRVERLVPASGGINTEEAADALAPHEAPLLRNFVPGRKGQIIQRGPLVDRLGTGGGSTPNFTMRPSFISRNDTIAVCTCAVGVSPLGMITPWEAPWRKPTAANQLAVAENPTVQLDVSATTNAWAAETGDGLYGFLPTQARLGSDVWTLSFNSSIADVNQNGGYLRLCQPMRWTGATGGWTRYLNAPDGGLAVKEHLQRLFILGGRDVPSGAPGAIEQNTLYWSDAGGPTADTTAMWKDDVSGLVNKIVVDSDDQNDFGVGLAKVGQNLCIFKRNSIHVLYGQTPAQFTVRTFTKELGCLDPNTIVESENGVYFLGQQGFMFFDGSRLVNVGQRLRSTIAVASLKSVGNQGILMGVAYASKFDDHTLILTIGRMNYKSGVATGVLQRYFSGVYDIITDTWCTFDVNLNNVVANLASPLRVVKTTTRRAASTLSSGTLANTYWDLARTFALETLTNAERGRERLDGTNYHQVQSRWESRFLKLADPIQQVQLHRLMISYNYKVVGYDDSNAPAGLYATIIDLNGNTLMAETALPAQGENSVIAKKVAILDCFSEANEVQVQIYTKDNTTDSVNLCAIYDVSLEYEVAKQQLGV